jgi:hypothetical protein
VNFNIDDLDLGELCDLEDVAGADAVTGLGQGRLSAKGILAVVWIVNRRTDAAFTLEDARKVKVTSINFGDDKADSGEAEG